MPEFPPSFIPDVTQLEHLAIVAFHLNVSSALYRATRAHTPSLIISDPDGKSGPRPDLQLGHDTRLDWRQEPAAFSAGRGDGPWPRSRCLAAKPCMLPHASLYVGEATGKASSINTESRSTLTDGLGAASSLAATLILKINFYSRRVTNIVHENKIYKFTVGA